MKEKIYALSVNYGRNTKASWRDCIGTMVSFFFMPILVPIMVLLSKLLNKPIKFWLYRDIEPFENTE